MQYLSWAIQASAILVTLFGLRVLMQPAGEDGQRTGLGSGYVFVLFLFWGLAAEAWVNGYFNGVRLGVGLYLLFPAYGALRKPEGSRLFLGIVSLILAVLLAGPVLREEIWNTVTGLPAD